VVTHQEVASMVGSVREVISRTMRKLKKEGVIVDTSVKGIKVDRKALARHLSAI
jgi:CRP/FNR family transcriptional regulator